MVTWPWLLHQKIGFKVILMNKTGLFFVQGHLSWIYKWLILNSCLLSILSQNPLSSCSERSALKEILEKVWASADECLDSCRNRVTHPAQSGGSVNRLFWHDEGLGAGAEGSELSKLPDPVCIGAMLKDLVFFIRWEVNFILQMYAHYFSKVWSW